MNDDNFPDGVKGWSWGAFLLNWIWAIGNKTWWGLLCLIPYIGFIFAIILGFKGREYAWKNNSWESFEHFDSVQKKWSVWGVAIIGSLFAVAAIGIAAAVLLPAYQDYKKRGVEAPALAVSSVIPAKIAELDYGYGIKTREDYHKQINLYQEKIISGEVHVFKAVPIYFNGGDREWPATELSKIGNLWWYEDDKIYMVLNNSYMRMPVRRVLIGMNYGRCNSAPQSNYLLDLGVDIKPGFYGIISISNQELFDYAFKRGDGLNEEEQKRWASGREDMNDCLNVVNAWSAPV